MTQRLGFTEFKKRFHVEPRHKGTDLVRCTDWKCLKCDRVFKRRYMLIRKRGGCPMCMKVSRAKRALYKKAQRRIHLLKQTRQKLLQRFEGRISINGASFKNNDSQALFKCVCGYVWKSFVKSSLKMKYGCNNCATLIAAYRKNKKVFDYCRRKLNKLGFEVQTRTIPRSPGARSTPITVMCLKCKHRTYTKLYALKRRRCCVRCKNGGSFFSKREVRVFGKKFRVQGYEHFAIRWIVENTRYEIKHVSTSDLPVFRYKETGNYRLYTPDIQAGNNIVEVKSTYTLGLLRDDLFNNVQLKAKSVEKAGYTFKLLVFKPSGEKLKIPRNWINLTRVAMIKQMGVLNKTKELTRFAKRPQ